MQSEWMWESDMNHTYIKSTINTHSLARSHLFTSISKSWQIVWVFSDKKKIADLSCVFICVCVWNERHAPYVFLLFIILIRWNEHIHIQTAYSWLCARHVHEPRVKTSPNHKYHEQQRQPEQYDINIQRTISEYRALARAYPFVRSIVCSCNEFFWRIWKIIFVLTYQQMHIYFFSIYEHQFLLFCLCFF